MFIIFTLCNTIFSYSFIAYRYILFFYAFHSKTTRIINIIQKKEKQAVVFSVLFLLLSTV